ncbi:MAG: hypothetical protein SGJ21_02615 [Alphaproteobacteria bacterium]|nr:hypothetical protein [Alphaproteobacteria bacterium]
MARGVAKLLVLLAVIMAACESSPRTPELASASSIDARSGPARYVAVRVGNGPIVTPASDPSIGQNIQGPSLIRVPDWVENRLGRYYLYFADHKGRYIRLAYADKVEGPWKIHAPGALRLEQTRFPQTPPPYAADEMAAYRERAKANGVDLDQFPDVAKEMTTPHIASPDVHVDEENKRIVMYHHGLEGFAQQVTRVAISTDGIHFAPGEEVLGRTYWRAFPHNGMTYALAMPGVLYRSDNPLSGFEQGPTLFNPDMRHSAVFKRGATLHVIWTQVAAEPPERLLMSTIDISGPWETWKESPPVEILRPEKSWEGANLPLQKSARSFAAGRVNQLRDPAIFEEDGRIWLLYAIAGESGIGLAELKVESQSVLP